MHSKLFMFTKTIFCRIVYVITDAWYEEKRVNGLFVVISSVCVWNSPRVGFIVPRVWAILDIQLLEIENKHMQEYSVRGEFVRPGPPFINMD